MLQELATQTGAAAWAIGSMLFFLAAWVAVVVWIARKRPEDLERQARLPLEDEDSRIQASGVGSQEESEGRSPGSGTAPISES
jgi:hypothetical protein